MAGTQTTTREPLAPTTEYEREAIGSTSRDQERAPKVTRGTRADMVRDEFHRAVMVETERQWGIDEVFDGLRIAKAIQDKFPDARYQLAELGANATTEAPFDSGMREIIK